MRLVALKPVALAILAALATRPARADEAVPEKARTLAAHGRDLFAQHAYARAIAAFQEAYAIAPRPALLFNLAQAYRLQGKCDDAVLLYRRYLATAPTSERARDIATRHLHTVQRCVQKRALDIPLDESEAYLDAPAPADAAGPAPPEPITPTPPLVDARLDRPAAISPGPPRPITTSIGLGLAVGGGVALAVAGYYAWRAHDASQDVSDAYERGADWSAIADLDARGERSDRAAKLFAIGGGVAVVGGVTLWILGRHRERAPLVVTPSGHGAKVSYAWRF